MGLFFLSIYWILNTFSDVTTDFFSSGGCRILGISYSSDKDESSFAALITAEGEVGDYLR